MRRGCLSIALTALAASCVQPRPLETTFWSLTPGKSVLIAVSREVNRGTFYLNGHRLQKPYRLQATRQRLTVNGLLVFGSPAYQVPADSVTITAPSPGEPVNPQRAEALAEAQWSLPPFRHLSEITATLDENGVVLVGEGRPPCLVGKERAATARRIIRRLRTGEPANPVALQRHGLECLLVYQAVLRSPGQLTIVPPD